MSEPQPTLRDLYAAIGETLVQWGFLEELMIDAEIEWKRPTLPDSPLRSFLDDLAEPRAIRNALAHGIVRSSAVPEAEPFVECRLTDGTKQRITLAQLNGAQEQIERLRRIVIRRQFRSM